MTNDQREELTWPLASAQVGVEAPKALRPRIHWRDQQTLRGLLSDLEKRRAHFERQWDKQDVVFISPEQARWAGQIEALRRVLGCGGERT